MTLCPNKISLTAHTYQLDDLGGLSQPQWFYDVHYQIVSKQ